MGLLDKAKEKAGDLASKASDLKNAGTDKIKEIVNEINSNLPVIKEAGYEINELEVILGLPPALRPHFYKVSDVSDDKINELLEANKDKKVLTSIMKALSQANKLQGSLQTGELKFKELEIELSIPPSINLKFYPEGKYGGKI